MTTTSIISNPATTINPDLAVSIAKLQLANPMMTASGITEVRHYWYGIAAILLLIAACTGPNSTTSAQSTQATQKQPADGTKPSLSIVKLGKILTVEVGRQKPLNKETSAQIKACITRLAAIDSPYFGFAPTLNGEAFAPLPGQTQTGTMLLTDHHLKSSEAFKSLVEFGPDALPFLLDALDDKTPTKLKIGMRGMMWFANELWGNPSTIWK